MDQCKKRVSERTRDCEMQFPQREAVLLKCSQMGLYLKPCPSPPQTMTQVGQIVGKVPQETNPSLGIVCRKLAWESIKDRSEISLTFNLSWHSQA